MASLSQALHLGSLLLPHNAFQEHAAHPAEWSAELSSKGSEHTCIRSGLATFLHYAFTAHSYRVVAATRGRKVDCLLRHEVARLIVWHAGVTRPAVPSVVSYADVREGNALYSACGHGTHSHPTGTRTVRERCIC